MISASMVERKSGPKSPLPFWPKSCASKLCFCTDPGSPAKITRGCCSSCNPLLLEAPLPWPMGWQPSRTMWAAFLAMPVLRSANAGSYHSLFRTTTAHLPKIKSIQVTLKGTNLRGQTEPKRRFSQIFADFRPFLENKAFGIFAENRRFSQEPAENRRNSQKTADWRLSP